MVKWETHDFQKVRKQFVSVRVRLAVKRLHQKRLRKFLAPRKEDEILSARRGESSPLLCVSPFLRDAKV